MFPADAGGTLLLRYAILKRLRRAVSPNILKRTFESGSIWLAVEVGAFPLSLLPVTISGALADMSVPLNFQSTMMEVQVICYLFRS
ncbi:hypothetical protein Hypma_003801 [Hypsizygus marmoreus]|uniref:Uncharacterized protein n=1 Tax=Hypsizygus marmoreus TaxID=39966 RepID=A0A369K200_HYPMA|nr:hypothetical protein Hypma_003801 [Hypsizygus marmoreus]